MDDRTDAFIDALRCETLLKAALYNDAAHTYGVFRLLAELTEEAGEIATALIRGRRAAVIAECVDVAHAALRLAAQLDPDGVVLPSLFADDWRESATVHWRETHDDDPPWEK